ncbi:MAG: tyrosine--tRNA ligase [Deltaproteobacteria bacterium]|nr:tyrosine--tRNA ligase [Deltaproteobacteria bacterium]MCL5276838.1 tyrosine--tRNA ligase [Deltaproteobacteria bacterium]
MIEPLTLIKKGSIEIIQEEELKKKLASKKSLRIKAGFDPTSADIHLGHTVLIEKLRHFQMSGHTVVFLIGDFTAMIGDPTGVSATRPQLSKEQVLTNARTYTKQAFKMLDPERTEVRYNSEWFSKMDMTELIRIASKYTVARLLERDDFTKRYSGKRPIGIHELLYPLMQGYDSVMLHADVEIGGSDQKFNLIVGRALQEAYAQEPQVVLTMPLLPGLDGTRKMSKSYENYIGIDEPADMIFGKIMSISDALMWTYYELLTDVPQDEVDGLKEQASRRTINPMEIKKRLASDICRKFSSEAEARRAREVFEKVFSKKEIPDELEEFRLNAVPGHVFVYQILMDTAAVPSKSEAKRLIQGGGIAIDNKTVNNIFSRVEAKGSYIVQAGKKKPFRVVFL